MAQIGDQFELPYMASLRAFLTERKNAGKQIFPPGSLWFNALNSTPFDQVRVVILGQDPYHGPNQAHGLCFSVLDGVKVPPSLQNIYKELVDDVGFQVPNSGNLQSWADQGVLLLNATLTVEQGDAGSHQGKGWERFTDAVVQRLNENRSGIVYILWGSYAQKKGAAIDRENNLVIKGPHPSPLSAYRGFFGSKPFSKTNAYLRQQGLPAIDWSL